MVIGESHCLLQSLVGGFYSLFGTSGSSPLVEFSGYIVVCSLHYNVMSLGIPIGLTCKYVYLHVSMYTYYIAVKMVFYGSTLSSFMLYAV